MWTLLKNICCSAASHFSRDAMRGVCDPLLQLGQGNAYDMNNEVCRQKRTSKNHLDFKLLQPNYGKAYKIHPAGP